MDSNKVFDAESESLHELYNSEGGVAGFRIPLYQRNYDWGEKNIQRLFEDISSGLFWRNKDEHSLTFLGTIIVLKEESDEQHFDGQSLSVIDGQQRLTTITIIATRLYEELRTKVETLSDIDDNFEEWLKSEVNFTQNQLIDLVYGALKVSGGRYFPFPRVVREYSDSRAKNTRYSEYRSAVANYLFNFSRYITEEENPPFEFAPKKDDEEYEKFQKNLEIITDFTKQLYDEEESSFNLTKPTDFEKKAFRDLFNKLPESLSEAQKQLSYCKNENGVVLDTLRLLLFANYLMESAVITIVKTQEEKYAFDIFDSLNTTGEPLTAIQTFKPQVIRFESDLASGYVGSESEKSFSEVEKYLNQFSSTDKKQKEAKDLVVPFALYLTGEKQPRSLDDQRRYLRNNFENISGPNKIDKKRNFILRLSEVADYKNRFWFSKKIEAEIPNYPERNLVLMCLSFLGGLRKSLTIPILCRFYVESKIRDDKPLFVEAVKSLTAFVVLRRAATGGTRGIDSDFRSIMSHGRHLKNKPSTPLCVGLNNQNALVDISTFREYLREWLAKNKIEITDKKSWIKKVINQSLATSSKNLCRFLILAATHNSRPDEENPWRLKKGRPGKETDYLDLKMWNAEECSTVEHIAPERPPEIGWDKDIYQQPFRKHSLGNLTLLPQLENSTVGNRSWKDKRWLYKAFAAETDKEIKYVIAKAKDEGFNFSKKNKDLIYKGVRLPLAKTISQVEKWDSKIIEKRSRNLAELAWDEISPWIFD